VKSIVAYAPCFSTFRHDEGDGNAGALRPNIESPAVDEKNLKICKGVYIPRVVGRAVGFTVRWGVVPTRLHLFYPPLNPATQGSARRTLNGLRAFACRRVNAFLQRPKAPIMGFSFLETSHARQRGTGPRSCRPGCARRVF